MASAKGTSNTRSYDPYVLALITYICSSGAKGNAKPKPCVKCEGKGWTTVTTAVS